MAAISLISPFVSFNAVDMGADIRKIGIKAEGAELATTNFGSSGWETFTGGLKKYELELEFIQDFTTGDVDSLLWPLFNTVVAWVYRPTTAGVGVSNPQYAGNVLVKEYIPVETEVGGLVTVGITLPGTGALTRVTI